MKKSEPALKKYASEAFQEAAHKLVERAQAGYKSALERLRESRTETRSILLAQDGERTADAAQRLKDQNQRFRDKLNAVRTQLGAKPDETLERAIDRLRSGIKSPTFNSPDQATVDAARRVGEKSQAIWELCHEAYNAYVPAWEPDEKRLAAKIMTLLEKP